MKSLCFCSAAFGSWGIVRLGTLVPESKMLFVCPYSCGRHNSIGAIKHGYKNQISYLFIDEQDIALGKIDDDLPSAVEELLDGEDSPKVMLIYFSCVLYMSGFDWEAAIGILSEKHPEIEFRACMMNPIADVKSASPVPVMVKTLCSLWKHGDKKKNTVNLLGNYSNLSSECELAEVLRQCGVDKLIHFSDFSLYRDYADMGSSRLNIVVRPEGLIAAKEWQDNIDYCFVPVSYDLEQIHEQYKCIFDKIGKSVDLSGYIQKAEKEINDTLAVVGNRSIAIGTSAVCRPYSLARALTRYGFNVSDLFVSECPDYEQSAKDEIAAVGKIAFHDVNAPENAFIAGKMGSAEIAVGYSAGYYSGAKHVVDLMIDEKMFGYGGLCMLMQKMRQAVSSTASVETMIESYGLII